MRQCIKHQQRDQPKLTVMIFSPHVKKFNEKKKCPACLGQGLLQTSPIAAVTQQTLLQATAQRVKGKHERANIFKYPKAPGCVSISYYLICWPSSFLYKRCCNVFVRPPSVWKHLTLRLGAGPAMRWKRWWGLVEQGSPGGQNNPSQSPQMSVGLREPCKLRGLLQTWPI